MGSSRLPGKVMLPLGGEPALSRVIERVEQAVGKANIVVATTTHSRERPIIDLCHELGVRCFRGSEDDVLGRVYRAALLHTKSPRSVLVDITADCPLVDPRHIKTLIKYVQEDGVDYASTIVPRSWPDGFDVQAYRRNTLRKLYINEKSVREHTGWNAVQLLFKEKEFRHKHLKAPPRCNYPTWRLTLDTKRDYKVLQHIYNWLYYVEGDMRNFTAEQIIKYWEYNLAM
jgi:spore coat polysaccharide biosynthesis protein SpsF